MPLRDSCSLEKLRSAIHVLCSPSVLMLQEVSLFDKDRRSELHVLEQSILGRRIFVNRSNVALP